MLNRLTAFCLTLALAFGGPALAQDDSAADGDTETSETAPSGTPDLDLGEPVGEGPQVSQPYIRETFGDWSMRCIRAPEGQADPCELYQLLRDADGNEVAEFSIVPIEGAGEVVAGATIVAPLETLLTRPLVISVDGGNARQYQYRFCNRAGCVAQVGFTADMLEQFKRGAEAQLVLVPAAAPDQQVALSLSLSGFTAGFEASEVPPEGSE